MKVKQVLLASLLIVIMFFNSACGISDFMSSVITAETETSLLDEAFYSELDINAENNGIEKPLIKDLDNQNNKYEFTEWLEIDKKRIEKYESQIKELFDKRNYEEIKKVISKLEDECGFLNKNLEFLDLDRSFLVTRSGAYVCDYKHTGAKYVVLAAINTRTNLIHWINNRRTDFENFKYETPGIANSADLAVTKIIPQNILEEEQKFVIDFLNDKRFYSNTLYLNLKVYILPFELSSALGVAFNTKDDDPHTIVLCNSDGNYRAVFLHELGHVFTYKIMKMKTKKGYTAWDRYYLPIYNISTKTDKDAEVNWEDDIYENFAEEFKIYMSNKFDIHDEFTDIKSTNFPDNITDVSRMIEEYYNRSDIQYRLYEEFDSPTVNLYDGDDKFINTESIFYSNYCLVRKPEFRINAYEFDTNESGKVINANISSFIVITDLISNKKEEYKINNTEINFKYQFKNYSTYSIEVYVAGKKNISIAKKIIIYEDFDNPVKYAF